MATKAKPRTSCQLLKPFGNAVFEDLEQTTADSQLSCEKPRGSKLDKVQPLHQIDQLECRGSGSTMQICLITQAVSVKQPCYFDPHEFKNGESLQ